MSVDGRIDSEVAGYRIVELLGRGGMSVVYRAEHVRLGRPAALKLLAATLGQGDHRERFLRESKLAASLDHLASFRSSTPARRTGSSTSRWPTWRAAT